MLNMQCNINVDTCNTHISPQSYKWNNKAATLFQDLLSSEIFKQKIDSFNMFEYSNDTNRMVDDLNSIFYEVSSLSLQQKSSCKSKEKGKQKRAKKPNWLDAPLDKLRLFI